MRLTIAMMLLFIGTSTLYGQNQRKSRDLERNICEDETIEDYQESVLELTLFIEQDSNNLHAYYNLGMSYFKLQYFDKAIDIFDVLITKDSCYNAALHNRAVCKYFLKDRKGACDDFRKALKCKGPTRKATRKEYKRICKS